MSNAFAPQPFGDFEDEFDLEMGYSAPPGSPAGRDSESYSDGGAADGSRGPLQFTAPAVQAPQPAQTHAASPMMRYVAETAEELLGLFPPDAVPSETAISFLRRCLTVDPKARAGAHEALQHPWLTAGAEDGDEPDQYADAPGILPPTAIVSNGKKPSNCRRPHVTAS